MKEMGLGNVKMEALDEYDEDFQPNSPRSENQVNKRKEPLVDSIIPLIKEDFPKAGTKLFDSDETPNFGKIGPLAIQNMPSYSEQGSIDYFEAHSNKNQR